MLQAKARKPVGWPFPPEYPNFSLNVKQEPMSLITISASEEDSAASDDSKDSDWEPLMPPDTLNEGFYVEQPKGQDALAGDIKLSALGVGLDKTGSSEWVTETGATHVLI